MSAELPLPFLYTPRTYQAELFQAWDRGVRRFLQVWPRGAGKDQTDLNFCIPRMRERPGNYYHVFPELKMGRRAVWDEINAGGIPFLDHFPRALCKTDGHLGRNEGEMTVDFANGSIYRICGADYPDRLRGGNPLGVIYSECSYMTETPWMIVEPRLVQNEGWAMFNSTPSGRNWFSRMYDAVKHDPKWYCRLYTIDDIRRDGVLWRRRDLYEEMPRFVA